MSLLALSQNGEIVNWNGREIEIKWSDTTYIIVIGVAKIDGDHE